MVGVIVKVEFRTDSNNVNYAKEIEIKFAHHDHMTTMITTMTSMATVLVQKERPMVLSSAARQQEPWLGSGISVA